VSYSPCSGSFSLSLSLSHYQGCILGGKTINWDTRPFELDGDFYLASLAGVQDAVISGTKLEVQVKQLPSYRS